MQIPIWRRIPIVIASLLWLCFLILAGTTWLGWFLTTLEVDLISSGINTSVEIGEKSVSLAELQRWLKATGIAFEPLYTLAGAVLAAIGAFYVTLRSRNNADVSGLSTEQIQRSRHTMLQKVKRFWIDDVLNRSLYRQALIDLEMELEPQAVATHPWRMVVQMVDRADYFVPVGTSIADVFDDMDQSLLILGRPGSGKTTMLLELTRTLIERAERDSIFPVPVVFNLSSWTERHSLEEWLVAELKDKYGMPETTAHSWLDNDELLPMLDGLDEVRLTDREGCIRAINSFRKEHLVRLVVCSRTDDYMMLTSRLDVQGAVVLQPLSSEQIDSYFRRLEPELQGVRKAVNHDESLQELAQSPLMLSVITMAYQDTPSANLTLSGSSSTSATKRLVDIYIDRMFVRKVRTKTSTYSRRHTEDWLAWLANRLVNTGQTVFMIERIQPSWLPSDKQRSIF